MQNASKDIDLLASYPIAQYKSWVWDQPAARIARKVLELLPGAGGELGLVIGALNEEACPAHD